MKTTKAHFELFKKESRYWIKRFGLLDWRVTFEHSDLDDDMARFGADELSERNASIGLNTKWAVPVTVAGVKRSAFHEVCHLLLCRMDSLARHRETDEHSINEENHVIVYRLENAFFEVTK